MRVLVTGGAGFVGLAVVRRLLKAGDSIVLYDLAPPPPATQDSDALRVIRGDVTDGLQLARVATEEQVDTIVHLAGLLAADADADPGRAVRVNCGGMINVLETARILGLRRVVWASSAGIFGGFRDGRLITNDSPFAPLNVYAASKLLNERIAIRYSEAFGVDTIGFRFSLMTGAGKRSAVSGRIGYELVEKPARGEPGRVPFGDDTPSWLWVDDAAEAVRVAVHHAGRTRTRVFNIGGETRSLREAAQIVRRLIPGADLTLEPGDAHLYHNIDVRVLEEELGFRPQTTLEEQLRLMIERARSAHASETSP